MNRKEERMELPPQPGAGPEPTGIEPEQLRLFDIESLAPAVSIEVTELRPHRLRSRPDLLHTDMHFVVRGERLEGSCIRKRRGL